MKITDKQIFLAKILGIDITDEHNVRNINICIENMIDTNIWIRKWTHKNKQYENNISDIFNTSKKNKER